MRRLAVAVLVVGGVVAATHGAAQAQSNQIRPRVLLMVDTSTSMTEHFNDKSTTGGDGTAFYQDTNITRGVATDFNNGIFNGFQLGGTQTCPGNASSTYDGVNSRIYAAKQAVANIVYASGDIDWGLMRYSGSDCGIDTGTSNSNANCTQDDDCDVGRFCMAGKCRRDNNFCVSVYNSGGGESYGYGQTRKDGGTCQNRTPGYVTYNGTCGTQGSTGAQCTSPQVCYADTDCKVTTAGTCATFTNSAAKACKCSGNGDCNGPNYTCQGGFCTYANSCATDGGTVLVDPVNTPSSSVLEWVDSQEVRSGTAITNHELHAVGSTPLAGAARAATAWYNANINNDTKKQCRPYVLVQMTDGFDSCDTDQTNGPVAAAGGFVGATIAGAKTLNKVYVVGLAFASASPTLDNIAKAGGTNNARLANSQQDIEAALADIVASSVLVEKCNGIDDNCNGQCDENFPGVAVSGTAPDGSTCSNPHSAATCDNGALANTLCFAQGVFQCSADQLSQQCSAPSCVGNIGATLSSPSGGVMRLTGVAGLSAGNVGQLLYVSGASKAVHNGAFVITAVGSNTVDVTNAAVAMPDANSVAYGVSSVQGTATVTANGTNEVLTVAGGIANVAAGDNIIVINGPAADNGSFTVASTSTTTTAGVTTTTITFAHAGATAGTVRFTIPKVCPNVETCNQKDDDCNGIVDDCIPGQAGSCCLSACPACAKPPFIETCNNCDDDCDGTVDNNLVDTGVACGNNVGDCVPGTTVCCSNDPSVSTCLRNGTMDQLWCLGGNPGYPKPADLCDGTDDNCNGVANDNPPRACFTDGSGNTLPGDPTKGICHTGIQACLTAPLPNGNAGCPAGWPAGKPCPNPTPSYDTCQGAQGAIPELCNGADDDCNGCTDNNPTDSWLNQDCCIVNGIAGNVTDCDNSSSTDGTGGSHTGTRCKRGKWACSQPGGACTAGAKTCVGSVAKSAEVCDTVDNDCDGQVDDVPGLFTPCTGPGINTQGTCRALLECPTGTSPSNPQAPICVQTTTPTPETCNGLDDDCDGVVDNPPLAPTPGGITPGTPCQVPVPPADKPPCKAGSYICVAGQVVCDGAVGPTPNQCNGISTDCTGTTNTNGNCPTGFSCYQGNCVSPCNGGEFPCPGGFVCQPDTMLCVPDVCAKASCPNGDICQVDKDGNAVCVDPCLNVTCPTNFKCQLGVCVDATCRSQGCPTGEICVIETSGAQCEPDPCNNVMCEGSQFCQGGSCHGSCAGPCPLGQYCDEGTCVDDPCRKVACLEGQSCTPVNGVGTCVTNTCFSGCNPGQTCCGGSCIADPCDPVKCKEDQHCSVNSACKATCETNPAAAKDQVVGAGGGGFACDMGGGAADRSSTGAGFVLALFGLLWLRRRRAAGVRR